MLWMGVLLFSTGPVMVAASSTPGAVLSFWRLWVGAALLGGLLLWRRRAGMVTSLRGWRWSAVAGLAFGTHQLLFMLAINATSVVDVTLMQALQPVMVGMLAAVMFGERPGAPFRLWSVVAVVGAVVVVLAGTSGPEGDPVGMALAVGNVMFFTLYFVWSKRAMDHMGAVPFLFGVAVVAAFGVSVFAVVTTQPVGGIGVTDLVIAVAIAVLPGGLGQFLSTHPLDRVAANIPPVMQLSIPLISGAMAWLLLAEKISWLHAVGGLITIAGVVGALVARDASTEDAPVVATD
jgi:drug/metabolite transporter (DMT)-like permease